MHRSDGSGTTYIFSNYLSSVAPAWAAKVGTGKTLRWPTGEGAEGNGGVAVAVNRTAFSISWALIYSHQASQATGQALVTMLDWLTHAGQAYAAANGYVPLPAQIQQVARTTLQQVTGPSGTLLAS
ncbi:MAG TPA: hypothetical protein VFV73_14050 [Streptosporangiaceae bacterium]|nr:hypothetical protein [Streptosporangiaceae bacterium]